MKHLYYLISNKLLLILLLSGLSIPSIAQTTITTESGTNYVGTSGVAGNTAITFVIQNTNATAITLTQVDAYLNSAVVNSGSIFSLWYSATSLGGAPTIATPTWTSITTGTPVVFATSGYYPVLTGLSFNIPGNTIYRFALQSSQGISYTGPAANPSPNIFSAAGVNLEVYDFQQQAGNVGWAGAFPSPPNNPRAFTGRIKFTSGGGCTAGAFTTQPSSATANCGGNATFTASATGSGITYQWQESTNGGTTYTPITNGGVYSGATTGTLTLTGVTSAFNNNLYRVVINGTCTPANTPSTAGVLTVSPAAGPTVSPANPVVCAGGIVGISITTVGTPVTATFSSGPISVFVPDNNFTGATHTMPVSGIPAGAVITGISVAYNMPHTWDGDMVFALKAPSGAILNLDYYLSSTFGAGPTTGFTNTRISSSGTAALSSGSNPYNGIFKADGVITGVNAGQLSTSGGPAGYTPTVNSFAALISSLATANGNWTLAMYDGGGGDVGTLTSWSITITYGAGATGVWSPNTGLYTDPAATVPYTGTSVNTVYAKPAASTSYTVTLSQAGCTSPPTTVPVTVNTPASITTQPAATSVCEGSNTSFSVTAAGTSPTYQWQVSTDGGTTYNNITGATSSTYTVTGATASMNGNRYRVVVSGAPPCGSVTSSAAVLTVNALPRVTISANRTKLIPTTTATLTATVTPAGTGTFQWFRNGVRVTSASTNSLVVNIDQLGDYNAQVTDANGCTSPLSNIVTISDTASGKLFLYPNPNKGKFHVRFYTQFYTPNALPPSPINATLIRYIAVINAHGQIVMNKPYSVYAPYGSMDVDLTPFGKGIYWIQVQDVQGTKLATGRAVVL